MTESKSEEESERSISSGFTDDLRSTYDLAETRLSESEAEVEG